VHDAEVMGVQVILVIEDNVRYYSSFLPVISGARVIVEAGFSDVTVAPSQGTHFFQT
jgi:hypothetical protein